MKNNNFKKCQIKFIKKNLKKHLKHSDFKHKEINQNLQFLIFVILVFSKINKQNVKLTIKSIKDWSFQIKYYECLKELKAIDNIKDNLPKIDLIVVSYANMIAEIVNKNFLYLTKFENLFLIQQLFKFTILYFYYDQNITKFNIDPNKNLDNEDQYKNNVDLNILKINALKEIKNIIMKLFPIDFNNLLVYLMQYSKKHY